MADEEKVILKSNGDIDCSLMILNTLKDIAATLKEINEKTIVLEPIGGRIMTKDEARTVLLGEEGD